MSIERSRLPGFYKCSVQERLRVLHERGFLCEQDYEKLRSNKVVLRLEDADKMVENVIGVFGLPLGLGLNFLINDKDYAVPIVTEEPSTVAALCSAAKLVRGAGGFTSSCDESIIIGQIQVVDVPHPTKAQHVLLQSKEELLNLANSLHPNMVARGGGAQDVEVIIHPSPSGGGDMVVVHLLVDTCDAMGANTVNTMCEGVASLVEKLSEGKVFLRILSNLSGRALVRAEVRIPAELLAVNSHPGTEVRDGIILANEFATVDPYRAATHNKGIMNGIDAVAIATGNDWRAIEAAAHAYAARGSSYRSLTQWHRGDGGELVGVLEMPLKVGIAGGNMETNVAVGINRRILGVESARELANVMAAVGLAQNFAALRALVTEGIQRGHMTLHARSVAISAGASPEVFDTVVDRLVEAGEVKVWKAQQIVQALESTNPGTAMPREDCAGAQVGTGFGKVILLGEHSVVYGTHAIAAPVSLAVQARVGAGTDGVHLLIPNWGVEERLSLEDTQQHSMHRSLGLILERLKISDPKLRIEVFPRLPRAMGLGSSAATAVAIIRAMSAHFDLKLDDETINSLAYECEKVAHGTPSGVDNTMATFGKFMMFRRGEPPFIRQLKVEKPIPIVIGLSGVESLTAKMVAKVRRAWEKNKTLYERIFSEIDALVLQGVEAIEAHDLEHLGDLMNVGQGLLNALGVSSWELEELIQVARDNGAIGAKLTGAGGGGSMVALCPDDSARVAEAIRQAGYRAITAEIGA